MTETEKIFCNECIHATQHATAHGKENAHVSCRVHRLRDTVRSQFGWCENPSHVRGDLKLAEQAPPDFGYVPNAPLDPARSPRGDPMNQRVIIGSFPGIETGNATAWPVITAALVDGEYDERRLGVLYVDDTGPEFSYLLDTEDAETAGMISLVVALLNEQAHVIDTCVYGKATPPEATAPAFVQRTSCEECPK